MRISVDGLVVTRGSFTLGPLSLSVESRECLVIMGPNASGKTTLLYALAGFLDPDEGRVEFDGRDATATPPEGRDLAFVFAEPALFPTMTVAENVAFSPRNGGPSDATVTGVMALLGIESLANLRPATLSTGQARRVELARALASHPRLLLLDEPYAAIHPADRRVLASKVRDFARAEGMTIVHVTHLSEDQDLGDRRLILEGGRISSAVG